MEQDLEASQANKVEKEETSGSQIQDEPVLNLS